MTNRHTRRTFLGGAAAAVAAPYVVPASSLGKAGRPAPSDRLTLGFVGLGSMGLRHVNGFLFEDDCRIIAVCDVDAQRRRVAVETIAKHYAARDCAQYNDFRELIARGDLDTVCIAVPDHWHSIAAIETLRAGKDVYGEKPLALTVRQGRAIVRAINASGRVWQTGSWQRSTRHFRFACELVRNGRIGKLKRVEVGLANGPTIAPQPPMPVPKGFDYERWLGPAPWRPYTEKRCHWDFRWILDYSGGQLTDAGAHDIDIAHWGMNADGTGPVEVSGSGEFPPDGLWDAATKYHVECKYASGITMGVASRDPFRGGTKFIGEDGWIHVARGGRVDASPKALLRERIGPNEIRLDSGRGDHRQGHRQNFLDCVRTRGRTIAPIEAAQRSITVAHLGNIAMILGRKVRWDPAAEEIIDDPTASRMLTRPMRSPWHD